LHERLHEQGIRIEQQIMPDLPPLWVDQELLRNCILNFINNAAQAMANGGTIRLGAEIDPAADRVRLTFADQGSGIAPEDLAKIFQPYFTTKDVGIGLGLAITERIIKEHGGEIRVASAPGEGTMFTVLLPLQTEQQEAT
jgi:signal transduction histidine kinase